MTTPPYARLGVRVNGGAPQYGGITVAHGDMVQFVAESTAYWGTPAAVWQIFDYPEGWTGPGAPWVTLTIPQPNGLPDATVFQYTGNTPPPVFTMPALPYWGKFMPSLFVNGGTIQGVAAPQLYDESTAVQILSPNALVETAFRETSQFGSWRGFAGVLKALVRLIDTFFSSVPTLSNAVPQAVGTASAGVGTESSRDDHVHAHGNQASDGSMHAAVIASGAAGFMTGADKQVLDDKATAATVNTLAYRGASGEAAFGYLYTAGTVATTGFIRGTSTFTFAAFRNAGGGANVIGLSVGGDDKITVGETTNGEGAVIKAPTTKAITITIGTESYTVDETGFYIPTGNTLYVNSVGMTASPTASAPMIRDAAGRSQVVDPSVDADIDTKGARNAALAAAVTSTRYTSNDTFVIPLTAKVVRLAAQGAGGGGGGGTRTTVGTFGQGGGGGGGGGWSDQMFDAAALRAIGPSITITIGASGTAGAGASVDDSAGGDGGDGGDVTFTISGVSILSAMGGGGGKGDGTKGIGGDGMVVGIDGTNGGTGGGVASPSVGTLSGLGGGGGGGLFNDETQDTGGTGGQVPAWRGGTSGGTGGTPGNAGSAGEDVAAWPLGGGGGGGGGASAAANGGAGGDGGISGGGGGGGGAVRNGNVGGDGGAGRAGSAIIETW